MARHGSVYAARMTEPWVGPTKDCTCEARWRKSVVGSVRLCRTHGRLHGLLVRRAPGGWRAHLAWRGSRTDILRGLPLSRAGFRSEEEAKAWATQRFYRLCRSGKL